MPHRRRLGWLAVMGSSEAKAVGPFSRDVEVILIWMRGSQTGLSIRISWRRRVPNSDAWVLFEMIQWVWGGSEASQIHSPADSSAHLGMGTIETTIKVPVSQDSLNSAFSLKREGLIFFKA